MKFRFILFSLFLSLFNSEILACADISLNSEEDNILEQINPKFSKKISNKLKRAVSARTKPKSRERCLSAPAILISESESTQHDQIYHFNSRKQKNRREKFYSRQFILNVLQMGGELNTTYKFEGGKKTPLMQLMAHEYNAQLIKRLLENKADPNIGNCDYSPLEFAITNGNYLVIESLLEYGACPDGGVDGKKTPLLYAIDKNQPRIVYALLRFGANPNLIKQKEHVDVTKKKSSDNRSTSTPLSEALKHNVGGVIYCLLANGADPLTEDQIGKDSYDYLAKSTLKKEFCNALDSVTDDKKSLLKKYMDNDSTSLVIQFLQKTDKI